MNNLLKQGSPADLEMAFWEIYRPPDELLELKNEIDAIRALHRSAIFHGTGRFNHKYEGRDKSRPLEGHADTLESILEEGLQPQRDVITRAFFPDYEATTSMTHNRVYAQCYSKMFTDGADSLTGLKYEFGDREFWSSYFMNAIVGSISPNFDRSNNQQDLSGLAKILFRLRALRIAYKNFLPFEKSMIHRALCSAGFWSVVYDIIVKKKNWASEWLSNCVRDYKSGNTLSADFGRVQSDIPGNYPVLLGLDTDSINRITVPRWIHIHESRTSDVVTLDQILFIEVPWRNILETIAKVREAGMTSTPVFPMELGEVASWMDGFVACAEPNRAPVPGGDE